MCFAEEWNQSIRITANGTFKHIAWVTEVEGASREETGALFKAGIGNGGNERPGGEAFALPARLVPGTLRPVRLG